MNKEILKKAIDKVAELGKMAEEKHRYQLAIASKSPDYIAFQRAINLNTLAISKALASGQDTSELEKKDKALRAKFEQLKAHLGVEKNYYHCPICKDKGQLPDGRMCECVKKIYSEMMREYTGLDNLPRYTFKDNNIENIPCEQQTRLSKLYISMQKYCDSFPNTAYNNILLMGKTGVGKTFLISCIANELFDRGFDVIYLTAFSLNNILLKYHTTDAKVRGRYLEDILNCDMLIIDDLGTEPILKNVTVEYIYSIINNRADKHTIISSNLNLAEISARYNERITSRFTNTKSLALTLNGDDLRLKN